VRKEEENLTNLLKSWRQQRHVLRLLLEDEAGKQSDDFFGLILGEDVVEDEFGKNEFVRGVDLR
jgi:hypothetical protein